MHRMTITLTAPASMTRESALVAFSRQLEDMADDLAALSPQNRAFGAYGEEGCRVYYRVELAGVRVSRDTAVR